MEVTPRTLSRRRILPSEIIGLNAVVEILFRKLFHSISNTLLLYKCNQFKISFLFLKILKLKFNQAIVLMRLIKLYTYS